MKGNDLITFRANFSTTPIEWARFRELCDKHGYTANEVFTRMFNKSIDLMENNQPLWVKLDDLEI